MTCVTRNTSKPDYSDPTRTGQTRGKITKRRGEKKNTKGPAVKGEIRG